MVKERIWHPHLEPIEGIVQKIGELCPDPADADFNILANFKVTQGRCWHVAFSPDESYFAWIATPRKVVLVPWDRTNNRLVNGEGQLEEKGDRREVLTIECGYPVLSVAFGCGRPELSFTGGRAYWKRFDFSEDMILATGHVNGRIRIWSMKTGKLFLELMDHKGAVRDLSFAPDGSLRLISASLDGTLKGWELNDDGNMFKTFLAHKKAVLWTTWAPNSKLMASTGLEKIVYIWDMKAYKLFRKLEGHCHNVVSCAFSPDGAVLATASWDTQVILWDPFTGSKLLALFHLHPPPKMIYASGANNAWVRGVDYAKDGLSLVSISDDQLVRFWNLMGDVDPQGIASHDEEALSVCYSPSGRAVAVGTAKFKVSLYSSPVAVASLMHLARMAIRRIVVTPEVEKLKVPSSIKAYLKYEVWA